MSLEKIRSDLVAEASPQVNEQGDGCQGEHGEMFCRLHFASGVIQLRNAAPDRFPGRFERSGVADLYRGEVDDFSRPRSRVTR